MQVDVKTLFKDGKRFYAIYSGTHDGHDVLSGATQLHQVKAGSIKNLKEGARVYFDKDGGLADVVAAKPPTTETKTRTAGCAGKPRTSSVAG
jgi:hypothetical protein